eukprot:CAMPEP_0113468766 /NCGR_PEP_ID=MMETSP0014_2-20120614/15533_1 /TAXON_ID=2857 /ORGANISM="Nitzschia sp." /LENGTH=646 /DNA_ID=CAMNT_0000361183 /DNA_START=245 /DNA_END=2185 /DNA_ORIENTATION=+ /assembly_acc=CAM_ASM_000159
MTRSDSLTYLVDFVRKLDDDSFFSNAVEVAARRVDSKPQTEGGTVRSPSFFVAFATEPFEGEEPQGPPTDADVEVFRKKTQDQIEGHLKDAYPETYESCELTIIKHETDTDQPDDRFRIYIENDFKAKFSADVPSEDELFNIIMKCAGTDSTKYMMDMQKIDGSQFMDVTMVTIQIIGLEMPEVEELEAPPSQDGDESEQPEDEEGAPDVVVYTPIFLALALSVEPPAKLPNKEELEEFQDLLLRFFYTLIRNEYPDSLKNLIMHERSTKFNAGIPEPRFCMCQEYDAEFVFKPGTEPPDEKYLQSLILECNLSSILAHTRNLEPLCFQHTTEVTMRRKSQKPGDPDPIRDGVFQAMVDLPPPEPLLSLPPPEPSEPTPPPTPPPPPPKKVVTPPREPSPPPPTPPSPPPKPVEKKKPSPKPASPKKIAKPVEEKKVSPKPASPKKVSKPKVEKKKKPKKAPKSPVKDDGYSSPTEEEKGPVGKVASSDVYVALKLDNIDKPPSDKEMEKLRASTEIFFSKRLKQVFPKQFVKADLEIGLVEFGKGKPKPEFNLYVEWIVDATFRLDASDPTSPTKKIRGDLKHGTGTSIGDTKDGLPDVQAVTRSLVAGVKIIDYLVEHVRVLEGSFADGTMIYIQQRIDDSLKK